MYRKYNIVDDFWCYFVTLSVIKWIPVFDYDKPRNILIDTIIFLQNNRKLRIHAYVIMPSHVHLIVSDGATVNERLKKSLASLRSYSSKKIISIISKEIPKYYPILQKHNTHDRKLMFWQPGIYPKGIDNKEVYWQKIDYIHNNPVKAALVANPEDWYYSSANYFLYEIKGPIDIFQPE